MSRKLDETDNDEPTKSAIGAQDFVAPEIDPVLMPGSRVDHYVVDVSLAQGGFATVYSAQDTRPPYGRVALKVLSGEMSAIPVMVERFSREVHAIELVGHPDIVKIIRQGRTDDGRPYYAMELIEGVSLREHIRQHGPLEGEDVLQLITPVCQALSAAHAAGIVHRDIKASNVMVYRRDGRLSSKLVDFGIAKILINAPDMPGLTAAGERPGSATAMSPEQILSGVVDARTDVYALGALLFQMFTGRPPFLGKDQTETLQAHLQQLASPPSSWVPVSPAIDAVILRCLQKKPEARFGNVDHLLRALKAAVARDARAASSSVRRLEGVAMSLEVLMSADAEAEMDEPLLIDLGEVLDRAEEALRTLGYLLPLKTDRLIVGVRAPHGAADPHLAERQARRDGEGLLAALKARPGADPRLTLRVSVKAGQVDVRDGAPLEVVGGALMKTEEWVGVPERKT